MAVQWIPDFSFFEYKAKNPIKLGQSLKYIQKTMSQDEAFKSLETLFWSTMLLNSLNKLDLLDKEKVEDYIKQLKYEQGGYKAKVDIQEPDTWSTFYCVAILKILRIKGVIDEKDADFILNSQIVSFGSDGGFIHCDFKNCEINCKGKASIASSFFAISTLLLLEKIDKIDEKRLSYHLNKETKDNIELIYQILSLKLLNKLDEFNLEKKIPIISNWQIPKSGFGINSKFPTVEDTFWVGICLGLLEKLEIVDIGSIIDFLKSMQQDDGGFTDQYTSISSKKPTLLSTAKGIIVLFYLWNVLIERIENEILILSKDLSEVALIPIKEKFLVSLDLVEEVVNSLITNKLIEGEIQDRQEIFKKYFKNQNQISQTIINKVMKITQSFEKQKELDLKEFSKQFDFSNPLERVKLVINDLLINKFIIGNIRTQKKRYYLENYQSPGKFILIKKPIPYKEILSEKKKMVEDKENLMKLRKQLIEFPDGILKIIKSLIDKEKIKEASKKLKELINTAEEETNKFEKFIININSSYKFIDFRIYNFKFQRNWPPIKKQIEDNLSNNRKLLEKLIKEKEEYLEKRTLKQKEQDDIKKSWVIFTEIKKKLNLYQVEIKNSFPKNYLNHEAVFELINVIYNFMNESDQKIKSVISNLNQNIKFDEFKKDITNLQNSWNKELDGKKNIINSYKSKIDKRIEIQKLTEQLISEIDQFIIQKKEEVIEFLNREKLEEASQKLKENAKEFNELFTKQRESFKVFMEKTVEEIPDFSKISSDLVTNWNEKLDEKFENWNNIKNELNKKLYSSQELEKKEELDKIIDKNMEDINQSIEIMKETVLKLVKEDNIIDGGKKTKELNISIEDKIKIYNQEIKDFIKNTSREFNKFRDTVSELTENWESVRLKLIQSLEKTIEDLREIISKKGASLRKIELKNLIKNQITELENKINKFKLKFNEYVESGKKIEDHEEILTSRLSRIHSSIKKSDDRVNDFKKIALKIYDSFEENISEENKLWTESKSKIENIIRNLSEQLNDEILIGRIQSIAIAFKENKVDLNYLSKSVKVKFEDLKMKIVELIANNKLIGELDPTADMLILKEERKPDIFITKQEEPQKKIFPIEEDPIKKEIFKLRYLMVIHNLVGATIYSRKLGEWALDPDLIGGFLTAMQSFGSEIKKEKESIKSMEYKGFEIIMDQGKYIFVALFIDGKESEWNRKKLKLYVEDFEKEYEDDLKNWMGEVATFKKSGFLVDKAFELFRI